jgi:mono-ADP-ribosyltransferase sirtuin 6
MNSTEDWPFKNHKHPITNMSSSAEVLSMLRERAGLPETARFNVKVEKQVISLVGELTVTDASLVNAILDEWMEEQKVQFEISRSGLKMYRPTASSEPSQFALSPNDADLTEFYDSEDHLKLKVRWLARQFKKSKHAVVYTGAGISTAAKIPDFRGPDGVWTRRDRGMDGPDGIEMEQAIPTYAHNCLVKMMEDGMLKYLTSQNVDGLHRRSGIPADKISELHGNCYKEICASCNAEILRDYDAHAKRGPHFRGVKDKLSISGISHITGRKCDVCGEGMLRDSIIHFGENLPEADLDNGITNAKKSDFAFCVGTSLRVNPACNLPELCKRNKGKMAILNLQGTGKDEEALRSGGILIHHKIDKVFEYLMKELEVEFQRTERDDANEPCYDVDQAIFHNPAAKPEAVIPKREVVAVPRGNVLPAEFYIGNTHSEAADNLHNWTFFVSSEASELKSCSHFIDKVRITLHHTFDPSEITLNAQEEKSQLQITRTGWGVFDIQVEVSFLEEFNREPMIFKHKLSFSDDRSMTVCKIPPKQPAKAIFAGLAGAIGALKPTQTTVRTESGRIYKEDKKSRAEEAAKAARIAGKSDIQVRVVRDEEGHAHVEVEEFNEQ